MATKQTIEHFKKYNSDLKSPCLEIGSLVNDKYLQYLPKDIHGGKMPEPYIGIDIFPGKGVDYTINLCNSDEIDSLPIKEFNTIHCHYVMEHVVDIFGMAKNIDKILKTNGVLLLSVPIAWKIHRIPIDMWRFTPQSLDYLFPNIEFISERCAMSLRHGDKLFNVDKIPEFELGEGLNNYPFYLKWYVKILRKLGLHNNVFNQRALLFETNLMMYGIKREKPTYTYFDPKFL